MMGLFRHGARLLVQPHGEWEQIRRFAIDSKRVFLAYILPISSLGLIAEIVWIYQFVASHPEYHFLVRVQFETTYFVLRFLWRLLEVYAPVLLLQICASAMGGSRDHMQSMKLVALSLTPVWLGEVFFVLLFSWVNLNFLVLLLRFYSFYLLYRGLPRMLEVSSGRSVLLTLVTAGAAWSLHRVGQLVISTLLSVPLQWPELSRDARTLLVLLVIVGFVGICLILGYTRGERRE